MDFIDTKEKFESLSAGGCDYEYERWFKTALSRAAYEMVKNYLERVVIPFSLPFKSYFELGPGPATWTEMFIRKNSDAYYNLLDISENMIKLAKARLKSYKNVNYFVSDIKDFETGSKYDFIFSSRAIEYVADKNLLAAKLANMLKPGGKGAIITKMPHYKRAFIRGRKMSELHGGQISPSALKAVLEKQGLKIERVDVVTVNFPLLKSVILNKALAGIFSGRRLNFVSGFFAESYGIIFIKPNPIYTVNLGK